MKPINIAVFYVGTNTLWYNQACKITAQSNSHYWVVFEDGYRFRTAHNNVSYFPVGAMAMAEAKTPKKVLELYRESLAENIGKIWRKITVERNGCGKETVHEAPKGWQPDTLREDAFDNNRRIRDL